MPKCKHGWTLEYLENIRCECEALVKAWERDWSHPFRGQGLAGAKRALRTVEAHIAEVTHA